MKYLIKFLIFLFTMSFELITSEGCSSSTGPIDNTPGRRDYTWTVDTLNIPYTVLENMWGSSPTDVWAVGQGGDLDKTLYHFNGDKWINDGISRPFSPTAVFGFSQNNVWFGAYGNSIWHYDGTSISKYQDYTIPDYSWAGIINIWGDSPDNVYAAGFADSNNIFIGVIQRFNGYKWGTIYTSPPVSPYEVFTKIYRDMSTENEYYVSSYYGYNGDTARIYKFNGKTLKILYSTLVSLTESAELSFISNEVYFILGGNVCIRENDSFKTIFNVPGTNFIHNISGRSRNDIFLEMRDGIAHFNGSDIQYLYKFDNQPINFSGAVIFDKKVFFLAYDVQNGLNLIFRGILK